MLWFFALRTQVSYVSVIGGCQSGHELMNSTKEMKGTRIAIHHVQSPYGDGNTFLSPLISFSSFTFDACDRWVWINGGFACGTAILSLAFSVMTVKSVVLGSTKLHDQMTCRVMRAPLSFFHTNPTGRIVNRFSKDQGLVDDMLPSVTLLVFKIMALALASVVLLVVAVPFILPLIAIILVLFVRLRSMYIMMSREVKRFEGVTRSPVYATLSEALKVKVGYDIIYRLS